MKLSIIIPVFNEIITLDKIISAVKESQLDPNIAKEIIIIDDGSTDGSTEYLKENKDPHLKILFHEKNQGKTAAVKLGIAHASGDYILIQDADLEYSPSHYAALVQKALEDNAPVVYGSRFLGQIRKMQPINRLANIISNKTINLLFRTDLTDFHTCHKLIKKDIFNKIDITSRNFSFDTEITAKLLKNNIPIVEIPINYIARDKKDGKKITWSNALETYYILFKCKFSRKD